MCSITFNAISHFFKSNIWKSIIVVSITTICYILAKIDSVEDSTDGNLTINLSEGIIDKIKIVGNERTKDYIIERNIITKPGSIYNEEVLKKDLAQVFSTQIFEEVDRNIEPSEENLGTYNLSVIVKEKTSNSIGFGGGIDTGLGAFGSISLREDNFMGKAQKVSLTGQIEQRENLKILNLLNLI